MERFIQLLDDIDDLVAMIGLLGERLRRIFLKTLTTCFMVVLIIGCVALGLKAPLIALATAMILFVTLIYHSVTTPRLTQALK